MHREPRGHQVELECLDPAAWPENVAHHLHVLVPTEPVVVALSDAVQVDGAMAGPVAGASINVSLPKSIHRTRPSMTSGCSARVGG